MLAGIEIVTVMQLRINTESEKASLNVKMYDSRNREYNNCVVEDLHRFRESISECKQMITGIEITTVM